MSSKETYQEIKRFLGRVINGDCLEVMRKIPENSIDAVVTDPPYGLEFMGKEWDKFKNGKNIAGGTTGLNTPFGRKRALPSFYQLNKKRFGVAGEEGENDLKVKKNFKILPRFFISDLLTYQEFSFQWAKECLRVLKPGGYLLSFGSTRTYHRMVCGIEDAGFEIRDCIMWVYGQGFPKSLNTGLSFDKDACKKELEKELGRKPTKKEFNKKWENYRKIVGKNPNHRDKNSLYNLGFQGGRSDGYLTEPKTQQAKQWAGWGTALKPAVEPIVLARKPLSEKSVAQNVLKWGTGGINIDGCRIKHNENTIRKAYPIKGWCVSGVKSGLVGSMNDSALQGRFPANLIHDGSEEVVALFPRSRGGAFPPKRGQSAFFGLGDAENRNEFVGQIGDDGSAARFFYCAKASRKERDLGLDNPVKNNHPTVKPVNLMRYLCRLVTPPKGIVLDPFIGSGTTAIACKLEGFDFIGIEKEKDYCKIAEARIQAVNKPLF